MLTKKAKKIFSLLLAVCLMLGTIPLTTAAEAGGVCTHEHGDSCSYVAGAPCGYAYTHDETCGYIKDDEDDSATPSNAHEHDTDCGYIENDLDDSATPPDGHEHDADCGYIDAVDCAHVCDADCGGLSLDDSGKTVAPTDVVIVAELDTLPDETLWQGYDFDTVTVDDLVLPERLTGADAEGESVTINGVTWESDPAFDPAVSVFYSFTPVLPQGYTLAEDVTAPVISVFIRPNGGVGIMPLAATGTMTIGGQTYTDFSADINSGTGWTWTANSDTLTLDNTYTGDPITINCAATDTINLVYTGNVSITSASASTIYCAGNLNISENSNGGALSLTSSSSDSLYCALEIIGVLTINSGTVNATAAGSGRNPDAAVIYGSRGATIDGNANVTANATGADASGIYVERGDITISTTGTVTANGNGTGGALVIMNGRRLNMSSGSLVLTGVPLKGVQFAELNINGGNITIGGTAVYRAELTLSGVNTETDVTAVTFPVSGYGISSVWTNAAGKLHFLLPAGNQTVTLTAGGNTHNGTLNVTTDNAATATLNTSGGSTTVNYSSGSFDLVIGNDGIGGLNGFPPANNANALGNTVNVTGGAVNWNIYGGYHLTSPGADATANDNKVNVEATFIGNASSLRVYGGWTQVQGIGSYGGKTAAVTGNTVNIRGGAFSEILGGSAASSDGPANATGNTVNFTEGTVNNIYGGRAMVNEYASTYSATATGNSVTISGGTVQDNIYGGHNDLGPAATGSAINNTVTIKGTPNLTTATLCGGFVGDWGGGVGSGDAKTGNTLDLHSAITTAGVKNFETLNFYLPATISSGGTMLTATTAANLTGVTVDLGFDSTAPALAVGNVITLIDNATGTFTSQNVAVSGYTFALSVSGGKLIATVTAVPYVTTYAVTYNLNGGTGTTPTETNKAQGMTFAAAQITGITAPSGKQFKEWNTTQGGTGTTYAPGATVTMPGASLTLYAIWQDVSATTYTITASAGTGGSISPFGSVTVNDGANQTFTITPGSYYSIRDVEVDGVSVGAVSSYTFSNVTANHTINAKFYYSYSGGGGGGSSSGSGFSGSSAYTWKQNEKGWWLEAKDGSYPKSAWQKVNGSWYYFDKLGYMASGWQMLDGRWYYLQPGGVMVANNWVLHNGKWYFLNPDGSMATGWVKWNDRWYYQDPSGAMSANTNTPDGFYVNENGEWVP